MVGSLIATRYNLIMNVDTSHVRGDKTTMVGLDRRWQNRVMKDTRMPKSFDMSKREVKEYKKNLGKTMTKKFNQGLPIYRGAKINIKG